MLLQKTNAIVSRKSVLLPESDGHPIPVNLSIAKRNQHDLSISGLTPSRMETQPPVPLLWNFSMWSQTHRKCFSANRNWLQRKCYSYACCYCKIIYLYSYSKYTCIALLTTLLHHEPLSAIRYKFRHFLGIRPWWVSNPFHGGMYVTLPGALTIRPPDRDTTKSELDL